MPNTPTNRVYYATPAEAFDNFRVQINVQETYEPIIPKFFSMTGTPPIFEDPYSNNMSKMNASLSSLVDIYTGKYIFSLINPEQDVPMIVHYLSWFIDSYTDIPKDKTMDLALSKIVETRNFFKRWMDKVKKAEELKANEGKPKIRSFGDGGYVK